MRHFQELGEQKHSTVLQRNSISARDWLTPFEQISEQNTDWAMPTNKETVFSKSPNTIWCLGQVAYPNFDYSKSKINLEKGVLPGEQNVLELADWAKFARNFSHSIIARQFE